MFGEEVWENLVNYLIMRCSHEEEIGLLKVYSERYTWAVHQSCLDR